MRTCIVTTMCCIILAACGADGDPIQPTMDLGVGVGSSGVHTYGGLGLSSGAVSVFLGF